jgi:transposase
MGDRGQTAQRIEGPCGRGHAGPSAGLACHAGREQDRAQAGELARQVKQITEENVELAYVDQGYTGDAVEYAAAQQGIQLEVVKHRQAKRGFVLLPRRWVVERISHGLPASAASCATMKDSQQPARPSTSLVSPAS